MIPSRLQEPTFKVYCVYSLEWPFKGDSNEYTQYTIFNIKKKITLNCPKSADMGFFQETQERVRNSHGKRAISVRATEVLLYLFSLYKNMYLYGYEHYIMFYANKFVCIHIRFICKQQVICIQKEYMYGVDFSSQKAWIYNYLALFITLIDTQNVNAFDCLLTAELNRAIT